MDSCTVANDASMFNLVFIKTNERRGGFVKNIFVSNIKADKMRDGVLGIETDVLYQWRDLVPTYEKRLTPISDVSLSNIQVSEVQFISRILGQSELPVKTVLLENIRADQVAGQDYISENLEDFQVR
jgi:polygalacturonase